MANWPSLGFNKTHLKLGCELIIVTLMWAFIRGAAENEIFIAKFT
jgi:hypothetical protein